MKCKVLITITLTVRLLQEIVLTWNGTPAIGVIPHGIFTGYNINVEGKV